MYLRKGLLVGNMLLVGLFFASAPCFATNIEVVFKDVQGVPLAGNSVKIIRATAVKDGEVLRIKGRLKRLHRLRMSGHLHAYIYSENGQILSDSKHRVLGLNSKRKGLRSTSFNLLIGDFPTETKEVFLEYHRSGHQEG